MASVNQATIIGFVGDNPKVTTTQNGKKVASFSVATTEKGVKSQNGTQYPDRTDWHNIVIWGKRAEVVEKYIHKGSCIYIQGKLRTRSYEDRNGTKRSITEIEAENLQLLDRKSESRNQNQGQSYQQNSPAGSEFYNPADFQNTGDDGDLPF